MIYYPLQLLQLAGIVEVLLVTGKGHAGQMIDLLGDGRLAPRGGGDPILELDLTYKVQTEPGGIAQVVGMAEDFSGGAPLVVVLGDNIFYGHGLATELRRAARRSRGATIFGYRVRDPQRYGVVEFGPGGKAIGLEEKPEKPRSHHAVTGMPRSTASARSWASTRRAFASASGHE